MIEKAVILLAGYGTRCLPFTKVLPKAMIPILNKPTIAFVVEELEKSGIKHAIFVLPRQCNGCIVRNYFGRAKKVEKFLTKRNNQQGLQILQSAKTTLKTTFVFTGKANGSGGALLSAARHLKGQDFCVLNGDDLFVGTPPLVEMMEYYQKHGQSVIAAKQVEDVTKVAAVVANKNGLVTTFVEKPKPNQVKTNLGSVGRYIFTNETLQMLKKARPKPNGEIFITDAIEQQVKNGKVYACQISAKRFDCGSAMGIAQATVEMALENKQYSNQFKQFLNNIEK